MTHGTQWSYQGRKCRCPECLAGAANRRRAYNRRRRGVPNPPEPVCPWCNERFPTQGGVGHHMSRWCPYRPADAQAG